jgi:hypothetical protein
LFIYLFSATELSELLKVPQLIEHYTEHKSQNNKISFLDFICIHYYDAHDNDGDDESDMKLPFKSHDNCSVSNSQVFFSNSFPNFRIKPTEILLEKTKIFKEEFIYSSFQSNIWQPPKLS